MNRLGQRVLPRRLSKCFGCGKETLQWLTHVYPYSPGSYRGTRLRYYYTCVNCGELSV